MSRPAVPSPASRASWPGAPAVLPCGRGPCGATWPSAPGSCGRGRQRYAPTGPGEPSGPSARATGRTSGGASAAGLRSAACWSSGGASSRSGGGAGARTRRDGGASAGGPAGCEDGNPSPRCRPCRWCREDGRKAATGRETGYPSRPYHGDGSPCRWRRDGGTGSTGREPCAGGRSRSRNCAAFVPQSARKPRETGVKSPNPGGNPGKPRNPAAIRYESPCPGRQGPCANGSRERERATSRSPCANGSRGRGGATSRSPGGLRRPGHCRQGDGTGPGSGLSQIRGGGTARPGGR